MQSCRSGRMIIANFIQRECIIWGVSNTHMISPLLRVPMVIAHGRKAASQEKKTNKNKQKFKKRNPKRNKKQPISTNQTTTTTTTKKKKKTPNR